MNDGMKEEEMMRKMKKFRSSGGQKGREKRERPRRRGFPPLTQRSNEEKRRAGGQNGEFTAHKKAQGIRPSLKRGQNSQFTNAKLQFMNSEIG